MPSVFVPLAPDENLDRSRHPEASETHRLSILFREVCHSGNHASTAFRDRRRLTKPASFMSPPKFMKDGRDPMQKVQSVSMRPTQRREGTLSSWSDTMKTDSGS